MKIVLCLALCLALTQGYSSKIEASLRGRAQADVLVYMTGHSAALASARSTFNARTTRAQKAQAVAKSLRALNQESVSQIAGLLAKASYKSYWVSNMVHIKEATAAQIEALAAHPKVDRIIENGMAYAIDEVHEVSEGRGTPRAEWGIEKIQCEAVANQGEGVVVGVIDTGTRPTHETIRDQYREEFGFYDAVNGRHDVSYDDNGHGTHCTGTIVGTLGIGCATKAEWIACKGLSASGGGSFAQLVECAEFMACPDPACVMTPDLVSNSWGGGGGGTYYDEVINTWHEEDIIPVFAAGNSGGCRTILSPADSRSGTIAVGATDSGDRLASFSSRGPTNWGEMSPDISAPGVNVRSAGHTSDTGYATMSGTSMACPHAAGVLALMRSKNPGMPWQDAKLALEASASENVNGSGQSCDGVPDSQWPNNHFGFGIINAPGAVEISSRK